MVAGRPNEALKLSPRFVRRSLTPRRYAANHRRLEGMR